MRGHPDFRRLLPFPSSTTLAPDCRGLFYCDDSSGFFAGRLYMGFPASYLLNVVNIDFPNSIILSVFICQSSFY